MTDPVEPPGQLSHYDASGRSRMVDVSGKPDTVRVARAVGLVRMQPDTLAALAGLRLPKGDPLEVARVAGILAAKGTAGLIPMCHPLMLSHIEVRIQPVAEGVEVAAEVRCTGPTGVEMEALTAVSVAALTVYDMCKAVDRTMTIDGVRLTHKSGGRGGPFESSR